MRNFVSVTAVAVAVSASGASAAQLDFVGGVLSAGDTVLTMPEATIVADAGTTLGIGDFVPNAVCPLTSGCEGAMTLTWNFDVENVNFEYGFGNEGDVATVTAYDSAMAFVGEVVLTLTSGTALEDLSGLGVFRTLYFDNTESTGAGYAYGNVNYDRAVGAVPVPASLPLLLAGLGGMALLRRSRKAA